MEITCVDARRIANLRSKLDTLKTQVHRLQSKNKDRTSIGWIDGQDVMTILNISSRTLQTYRDNGTLPFTQIGAKIYYKPSDVESILQSSKVR